jgi:glycosyltransferase involved in cell wall biosynthesis
MEKYKIALFHPWIKSRGGAEKVVLEILEKSKNKIDVYTWVYEPENTFEEFKNYKINIIAPRIIKKFSRLFLLRGLFLFANLFNKIPLEKYDLFLISTSGVGEFITFKNYKPGKTFAYIHTPLRDANKEIVKWNLNNKYKNKKITKLIYLISVKIYKYLEKKAWKKLDVIIFNSDLSRKRAEEHGLIRDKKIKVISPPLNLLRKEIKGKEGNYFVYVSRINPPKRQDVLIKAWKGFVKKYPKMKLLIVGTSENKRYLQELERLSKETKNIIIKTNVKNDELSEIIYNSKAGLFLGYLEDFGITPLEIISAGKPLLAVDKGGYVSLIKDHPLFYRIKEKSDNELMVNEIKESLEKFMKLKPKKVNKKIEMKNFAEEIDKFIKENKNKK